MANMVDCFCLVLAPAAGDELQVGLRDNAPDAFSLFWSPTVGGPDTIATMHTTRFEPMPVSPPEFHNFFCSGHRG